MTRYGYFLSSEGYDSAEPVRQVGLHLHGKGSVNDLAAWLSELPSVRAVTSDDANVPVGD